MYKKGDKNNVENYRGISLMNADYKIYAEVLRAKLGKEVEEKYLAGHADGFSQTKRHYG